MSLLMEDMCHLVKENARLLAKEQSKPDERGIVIRNKARLVAQGHTQEEGIDYDELFSPVARIEAIRLFLAYASFMGFTIYQMDAKSAFLYGPINKEVYTNVATSTTEAGYVATASGCGQVLWIQNQLLDYGLSMPCEALSKEISSYILLLIETTDEGTKILAIIDGQFSHQWKYLIHIIMQCLSPKSTGFNEFSSNIATTLGQYTRRARIAQSLVLPTAVDEPASPIGDDSQGEACLTVSGLEAKQDRANIIKTSTLPSDSTPRVNSLATDEGNMQHKLNELTNLYATIKGRRLETREEVGIERSTEKDINDTEEMVNILTSLDAASVLTSRVQVSVPPTAEIATSLPPAQEEKEKKMVESDTPKKKKLQELINIQVAREIEEQMVREDQRRNEQIEKDVEIARIHAEEELQMMIDALDRNNETASSLGKALYSRNLIADGASSLGKIVENKMLKAFPLPVMSSHCQKKFSLLVRKVPLAEDKRCHC
nr:copia protein [Tanacetum cinerariifolium]